MIMIMINKINRQENLRFRLDKVQNGRKINKIYLMENTNLNKDNNKNLKLKHISLYKNSLGFFERSANLYSSLNEPLRYNLSVLPENKALIIDTLSYSAPGLVTTNYDTENHLNYIRSINPSSDFKFNLSKR